MWQDRHSGLRRHKLMTKELGKKVPALGTYRDGGGDDALIEVKLFSPYSGWRWYLLEWDSDTGECFGYVEGFEKEIGYFNLDELAETKFAGTVPAVERDLYWSPKTLKEIRAA